MAKQLDVQVLPDAATLARVAGDAVVRYVQDAIVNRGRATVALSGGQTPDRVYQLLAGPPHSTRLDFSAVHFFFVDERCVPPDDEQSNFGRARRLLFVPAGVPDDHVHRIVGERGPAAAGEYERTLRGFFSGDWPEFDLVLLGLGGDGHTASLFPGEPVLAERSAWVGTSRSPVGVPDRVTLTLPVIRHARQIVFLVSGSAKADIVAAVLERMRRADPLETGGVTDLPAAAVVPVSGGLRWLLDAEAAGKLGSIHEARER